MLFESGNTEALEAAIQGLWEAPDRMEAFTQNCRQLPFDTLPVYCEKLMKLYKGEPHV